MGKINFVALNPISDEALTHHRAHSHSLGLPEVGARAVASRLAVIGSGPSIKDNVDKIKNFDGEVWAINDTYIWCRDNDIDAGFYAVDPQDHIAQYCSGARKAVLADIVCPEVFKSLSGADIELAKLGLDAINNWSTAASTAPMIASRRGHQSVTFFGCESSFVGDSHAFKNDDHGRVWVKCGGEEHTTTLQLIHQAEFLAELARGAPNFITVEGSGFLPALIKHGDYSVTHVCRSIHDKLKRTAAYATI